MKVTFEATIDDFVDISVRSAPRDATYYANLAFAAGLAGTAYGGIGYLFLRTWIAAAIGFAIGVASILTYNYKNRERKLREFYQGRKLINGPLKVEAEIGSAKTAKSIRPSGARSRRSRKLPTRSIFRNGKIFSLPSVNADSHPKLRKKSF
jgi:hypothetical protein